MCVCVCVCVCVCCHEKKVCVCVCVGGCLQEGQWVCEVVLQHQYSARTVRRCVGGRERRGVGGGGALPQSGALGWNKAARQGAV